MAYRVILVEGNQQMLERLSGVIRSARGFELAARYQRAGDALGQGSVFKPDIVLLDIDSDDNVSLLEDFVTTFREASVFASAENGRPAIRRSLPRPEPGGS